MKEIRVLLIEDEDYDVRRIGNTLRHQKDRIRITDTVDNGNDAVELLRSGKVYDVVIMDFQISGTLHGEALIRELKSIDAALQILVITKMTLNQSDLGFANSLMEAGAFWYGTKYPGDIEDFIYQPTDLIITIINAWTLRQTELSRRMANRKLDQNIQSILDQNPLVGESQEMKELDILIRKYSQPDANVLIVGESGTGKELIAKNIHYTSPRKYEPFVAVNCAAIPKNLFESELFGYEKGAFTGAGSDRAGLFEQADGGTLFLDEITELPLSAQAKLLRVLQDGEIDKLNRKKKYSVNVRIIAATNKTLEDMADRTQMREDLFYRLNILHIHVAPLRRRHGDIPLLIRYFLQHYSNTMGLKEPEIKPGALLQLEKYPWPGNVRQLKNVIQRLVILASSNPIDEDLVNTSMVGLIRNPGMDTAAGEVFPLEPSLSMKEMDRKFRKTYIEYLLKTCRTDSEAAEKLGMPPSNFHRTCKDLGIK